MFKEYLKFHNKSNDKVKQIARPLLEAFPFTHIWYYSITNEGNYAVLGSRQDWTEYFFSKEIYKTISPFFRHPKYFSKSKLFYKTEASLLRDANKEIPCQLNTSLVLLDKTSWGVQGFGLATTEIGTKIDHLYLNEMPLLKQFIHYFKEEAMQLIASAESTPLSIEKMIGKELFLQDPFPNEKPYVKRRLLKQMGIDYFSSLTTQEKKCLLLVLRGRSANEIGQELNLSPRTVEYYLENAKIKLDCHSRPELFDKAILLNELNLL